MFNPFVFFVATTLITLEGSPSSGKGLWMPDICKWQTVHTYGTDCLSACTRTSSSLLSVITMGSASHFIYIFVRVALSQELTKAILGTLGAPNSNVVGGSPLTASIMATEQVS